MHSLKKLKDKHLDPWHQHEQESSELAAAGLEEISEGCSQAVKYRINN